MIGIDTNVLVRLIVGDDSLQKEVALATLRMRCTNQNPGFINRIVICELAWVLKRVYRFQRESIADAIEALLRSSVFEVEDASDVWGALWEFRNSKADFPDCLLAQTNLSAGCSSIISFDKEAGGIGGFEILQP